MAAWMLAFLAVALAPAGSIEKARAILDEGLRDKSPEKREQAALALALSGESGRGLPLLAGLLKDPEIKVRLAAVSALPELGGRRSIPSLKPALNDKVPEVAFAAAKALWLLNDPTGRDALLSILAGETRAASNPFVAEMRDMIRAMKSPKSALLFAFRQGVGFVPVPGVGEGVSALQSLVSDSGLSPRAEIVLLIARENSSAARAAMIKALKDEEWSVRAAAVQAIAQRNRTSFRRHLAPLMDDEKIQVQYRAAAAYIRLSRR